MCRRRRFDAGRSSVLALWSPPNWSYTRRRLGDASVSPVVSPARGEDPGVEVAGVDDLLHQTCGADTFDDHLGVEIPRSPATSRQTSYGDRSLGSTSTWGAEPAGELQALRFEVGHDESARLPRDANAATADNPSAPAPMTMGISPGDDAELRT